MFGRRSVFVFVNHSQEGREKPHKRSLKTNDLDVRGRFVGWKKIGDGSLVTSLARRLTFEQVVTPKFELVICSLAGEDHDQEMQELRRVPTSDTAYEVQCTYPAHSTDHHQALAVLGF